MMGKYKALEHVCRAECFCLLDQLFLKWKGSVFLTLRLSWSKFFSRTSNPKGKSLGKLPALIRRHTGY